MVNILVLEDNPVQRKILVETIKQIDKHFIIYEGDSEKEGLEIANKKEISLFYVDISLKGSSGLDFAKKVRTINEYKLTWIVFITTYVKHMLEAFKEIHCYDYIIKPYKEEKVREVTLTLLENKKREDTKLIDKKKYMVFNVKGILLKLCVDEIIFIEVYLRTFIIHTKTGKYEAKNTSLKKIKEQMKDFNFIQVHKSYIVNLKLVKSIDRTTCPWNIQFENYKECVPIGNKFKDDVLKKFKDNFRGVL
ncbi:LytR/AlgR family response regulator transcription factor [Clostridium sp. BJN0013]|uniref:LytR/AlgR family response regulator transcription factor n=1 Tax=Clostridium sp. BJN0013 TaxID=3236840 RepID=UPI0034C5EFEE